MILEEVFKKIANSFDDENLTIKFDVKDEKLDKIVIKKVEGALYNHTIVFELLNGKSVKESNEFNKVVLTDKVAMVDGEEIVKMRNVTNLYFVPYL